MFASSNCLFIEVIHTIKEISSRQQWQVMLLYVYHACVTRCYVQPRKLLFPRYCANGYQQDTSFTVSLQIGRETNIVLSQSYFVCKPSWTISETKSQPLSWSIAYKLSRTKFLQCYVNSSSHQQVTQTFWFILTHKGNMFHDFYFAECPNQLLHWSVKV